MVKAAVEDEAKEQEGEAHPEDQHAGTHGRELIEIAL